MRVAGRLAADVLDMIGPQVVPGVTTDELNQVCHDYIVGTQQAIPAPLGYRGFPKSICTSVNHVVCHGIPGDKKLKQGDIVNVDITVIKDGLPRRHQPHVPRRQAVAARRAPLCDLTRARRSGSASAVRPGARLGDIGATIQKFVEANHYSVVREYCGHGIGRGFHEDPQVLHYGTAGTGLELEAGMTFTIEPMVNAGRRDVRLLPDGWTVITGSLALGAMGTHDPRDPDGSRCSRSARTSSRRVSTRSAPSTTSRRARSRSPAPVGLPVHAARRARDGRRPGGRVPRGTRRGRRQPQAALRADDEPSKAWCAIARASSTSCCAAPGDCTSARMRRT
jgi:methionyl aminopeptidase